MEQQIGMIGLGRMGGNMARRLLRGERVHEAHRSHAYQRLSRLWCSHSRVTLVYVAVDLVWLAPWAWVATVRPSLGALSSVIALLPLFIVAAWLGAGKPDDIPAR